MTLEEFIYIHNEYQALKQQAGKLQADIQRLEQQGLICARPYWMRKDDPSGKPDQLELTHSTNSDYYQQHGTRREYIGVKPEKIQAVLDGIKRYKLHRDLQGSAQDLTRKINAIERQFKMLEAVTFGKQTYLWS